MNRQSKPAPTMKEVAKAANTSVATVSRVINGNRSVSPDLEERVRKAMKELNYHPSSFARAFKMNETRLIGILIPLLDHPFYGRLATAIEQELFANNYRAIICNSEEDEERESAYLEVLLRQRVDGIIINSAAQNTDYVFELEQLAIPYLLIDRNLEHATHNKVFCDNSQGGYQGMRYLLDLGHRRIGIVAAPTHTEPIIRRIEGAKRALDEVGVVGDDTLISTADTQLFDVGYEAGKYLLSLDNPPTAIFALTDVTAVGVIHAISELGLSIPDDVSVLGYDDVPIASYMVPPLSTVAQPIVEMGKKAVQLLLKSIQNPESVPEKAVLKTKLIERKSTAPPKQSSG